MPTSEPSTRRSLLSAICLCAAVAATIAAVETAALILTSEPVTPRTAAALVLTGTALYASIAAAVAVGWAVLVRPRFHGPGTAPAIVAVAGTVAAYFAVTALSFSDRPAVRHPVVFVGLVGVVVLAYGGLRRMVAARPWLGRVDFWAGLLAATLTAALIVLTAHGNLPTPPAAAALGTLVVAGCIAVAFRRSSTGLSAWATGLAVAAATGMFVVAGTTTVRDESGDNTQAPSVLLVTVDTLRSDHVGAYGYARARTPNIDRLAAEGATFLETVTPIPETGPAHASILSGLYPWHHGASRNGVPMTGNVATLADTLKAHNYATAAIVSGWTVSAAASGLGPHFTFYDDNFSRHRWLPSPIERLRLVNVIAWVSGRLGVFRPRHERSATATSQAAVEWLEKQGHGPFFLWVHFYDPHGPYAPPAQFAALHGARTPGRDRRGWYHQPPEAREAVLGDPAAVENMVALYDGEITYTDLHVGRVRAAAERASGGRPLLIVLTADHGESLTEHGHYFDHLDLYDVNLRVPLIVHYPDRIVPGTRVDGQTRLVDIAPTVMELVGFPPPPRGDGASLVRRLRGKADPTTGGPALANSPRGAAGGSVWAARQDGYKLLTTESWWVDTLRFSPAEELYDLSADPEETHNLAVQGAAADRLRELLVAARKEGTVHARPSDPGVQERLRALGYGN